MSEDDRAAKAARAKALLNKRRQKKPAPSSASGTTSPASPSRTLSPAPVEASEDTKHDLNDILNASDQVDTSWLKSLPRAGETSIQSSPVESTTPSRAVDGNESQERLQLEKDSLSTEVKRLDGLLTSTRQALKVAESNFQTETNRIQDLKLQLDEQRRKSDEIIANEKRTVSLLVSEKASLMEDVERLGGIMAAHQSALTSLEAEQGRSQQLESKLKQIETARLDDSKLIQELRTKEKELTDKTKDQERQQQLATATMNSLRKEAEGQSRKIRELEERIQSDDRVERLESSLKNAQDRTDELEFQLSKIKQMHATIKNERDELQKAVASHANAQTTWDLKHSDLQSKIDSHQQLIDSLTKDKDSLLKEKNELQIALDISKQSAITLQERISKNKDELSVAMRQLQAAELEQKNAVRRADDAEKIQKELQSEGTMLLRSVDEMRPKIVELTALKLDLSEKLEGMERALHNRDATISRLETTLEEVRDKHDTAEKEWKEHFESAEKQWRDQIAQRDKDDSASQLNVNDMQKALTDLQEELNSSHASVRTLESDRSNYHQEAARRMEEIERLTATTLAQDEELETLRQELDQRESVQEEENGILDRAQNEIESLRAELHNKEEELERLREIVSSPLSANVPRSLDDEMLSSLNQQHTLDVSTLQSKIRALETSLFEAEAQNHALQKQITMLQEQNTTKPPNQFADAGARRPSVPSSKMSTQRPVNGLAPPIPRSVFDQSLSPEIRHKRKVGLSMLKARIDSELAAAAASSHPPSRALSPDGHVGSQGGASSATNLVRPHFLDDSHIFWCHSCSGDLVVL